MKRKMVIMAAVGMSVAMLEACGSEKESQTNKNDTYFEIVEEINNENYDSALLEMEDAYGTNDYTGVDGFNKMNLYRLYCEKQEMYEEEITVLLDYLQANDFETKLALEEISEEKNDIQYAVDRVKDILDKVSPSKKENAVNLIGENLLQKNEDKE